MAPSENLSQPPQPPRGLNDAERLGINYCDPKALIPNEQNPKEHSKAQIKKLTRSIKEFGFVTPILIDQNSRVIAGHARLLAALDLALPSVPVIQISHLNQPQILALTLADNRLSEDGRWNDKKLGAIFLELTSVDLNFDVELTGFAVTEIDLKIEGLESQQSKGRAESEKDDTVALPEEGDRAVTRLGDVWVLGRHRLICANSLLPETYAKLMAGHKASLVFTDPPYGVPIHGHVSGNGATKHREFPMGCGEMSSSELQQFLRTVMTRLAENSTDGSIHFVCMDWRHQREILEAGASAYSALKNCIVWVKDKAGMGSLYRSQHELIFVFKSGTARHRNNVELGQHGRYRTNVWNYPGASTLSRQGSEGNLLAIHPTVKPISLVVDALLDCSARNEIVLDAFLGSGTTLLAAHRIGRICYGIELDPLYVDLAILRWQTMTGEQAVLERTGELFDDLQRLHLRGSGAPADTAAEHMAGAAQE